LEKLISKRSYLDYNASSPLSDSVIQWLGKGDFFFANPSSLHTSGRESNKIIRSVIDYLYDFFGLKSHTIFFHSGSTEGINTIIKGFANIQDEKIHYFYSETDHAAARSMASYLKAQGHFIHQIIAKQNGACDERELIKQIICCGKQKDILNYTHVNNETGVVWDLNRANNIKKATNCFIHVDSSQTPGKVEDWKQLSDVLDAYTFSGHKFGSLKGIGFSFLHKKKTISPLIEGGGQQNNIRSGTENTYGIYSLKLAFDDLSCDVAKTRSCLEFIEQELVSSLGAKITIVGKSFKRSSNTICLIVHGINSDTLAVQFDMAGIDIGTGSACSSGIKGENHVVKSMGFSSIQAKSVIRISFELFLDIKKAKEYATRIITVLQ